MKLELWRRWLTEASTVGELYVDGEWECYVLEDRYRPPPEKKVPGATAIPCGTYGVKLTHSPRFQRILPLLVDVPGFSGVRIHPGNTIADTEGCLLPGRIKHGESVKESRVAFHALLAKLEAAGDEPITITIDIGLRAHQPRSAP